MITASDKPLYLEALRALSRHKATIGSDFKGRFAQIFLALKFYQNEIPSMYSNTLVSTDVLQTLLDDLYAKTSRPANEACLMLFDGRYLARTGLVGPGNRTSQNTWRNNFNLQKGIGCYAPPTELSSSSFLNESRTKCRHLVPAKRGLLSGARCNLCLSGASYRNEDHRKWLRIDPGGAGYAVADLLNHENFSPYVAPNDLRIPVLPLIVALYHDGEPSLFVGQRPRLDVDDFRNDFNFSLEEFSAYFDEDPGAPGNRVLISRFPTLTRYSPATSSAARRTVAPRRKTPASLRLPVLSGTLVTPPATNSGFEAEQFVAEALRANRWTVYHVARQLLGYDILAKRGSLTRYVEVKSSLGLCSPSLTSREWRQANAHGVNYVLAIIENFDALGQNTVFWVPDPVGSCAYTQSQTVSYSIPRSSWVSSAVAVTSI
jgi:hypothetical protein